MRSLITDEVPTVSLVKIDIAAFSNRVRIYLIDVYNVIRVAAAIIAHSKRPVLYRSVERLPDSIIYQSRELWRNQI